MSLPGGGGEGANNLNNVNADVSISDVNAAVDPGGYSHRNAIRGCVAQMGRFLTKNP